MFPNILLPFIYFFTVLDLGLNSIKPIGKNCKDDIL